MLRVIRTAVSRRFFSADILNAERFAEEVDVCIVGGG
jgi:hypothetical protein